MNKDKSQMIVIATHSKHIDNGGVTVSIIDKGRDEGIVLEYDASYYGYPAIKPELRIDFIPGGGPSKWLENVGIMLNERDNNV